MTDRGRSPKRRVLSVVGTRPNFMKTLPLAAELARRPDAFEHVLVHTGQHYDKAMSDVFFEDLGASRPDHVLEIGSGTHAQQTARVMERLEALLLEVEPDVVVVPGDVNSTLAAALTAVKLGIPVAHLEAGLRSFDRTMPEEVNRVVTDQIADLLFTHSPEALDNLVAEGRSADHVHLVGNTMIDSLVAVQDRIAAAGAPGRLGLEPGRYVIVTLHRPALVDGPLLTTVLSQLRDLAAHVDVVFPVHPRTRSHIERQRLATDGIRLLEPQGYLDFMGLITNAAGVLTDSGGIQEETTYLRVPCFTLRSTTERPVTCTVGSNVLLGLEPERIADLPDLLASASEQDFDVPPLWDGRAAARCADVLEQLDDYRAFRTPLAVG